MRVSVALHTAEPDEDGNQRQHEARYCGYNRAYTSLDVQDTGDAMAKIVDLAFPNVQADPDAPYTHFSLGVCEGIDPGKGGSIIIYGPLPAPLSIMEGNTPIIADQLVGVHGARLDAMRADGRMGEGD